MHKNYTKYFGKGLSSFYLYVGQVSIKVHDDAIIFRFEHGAKKIKIQISQERNTIFQFFWKISSIIQ